MPVTPSDVRVVLKVTEKDLSDDEINAQISAAESYIRNYVEEFGLEFDEENELLRNAVIYYAAVKSLTALSVGIGDSVKIGSITLSRPAYEDLKNTLETEYRRYLLLYLRKNNVFKPWRMSRLVETE